VSIAWPVKLPFLKPEPDELEEPDEPDDPLEDDPLEDDPLEDEPEESDDSLSDVPEELVPDVPFVVAPAAEVIKDSPSDVR
jgi:hypothetical protein